MKKILMSMGLMFAALTLTNCSQDINDSVVPTTPAGAEFSITASLDATRTVAEGMSTTWAAEDGMNIMHAVADAATYTNDGEFAIEDVAAGQFKGTLGADLESEQSYDWYAIYPYNENISSPASTDKWRQLSYKEQTQEGYDSTAHIVGANGALYGITEGVANDAAVTFQMHHLTSMLAFNVTNKCEEPFIIQSVAFTAAGKDIAGTFYVDITGDAPTYVSSGDAYTFETITLTVANGEEVAVNGSAMLYMSVVPFAVATDDTLEVVVNTNKGSYTKSLTMTGDVTFAAGKATKLSVNAEFDIENFEVVPVGVGLDANKQQETLSWTYGENDNFTTTIVKGGTTSTNPREDTYGQLRMYVGNELTFTAVSGSIVKIEMTVTEGGNTLTASVGNMAYDEDSKVITWTGRMNEVKFTTSAKIFFNPIKVYYSDEDPIVVQPLATPEIIAEVQNLTEAFVIWDDVENAASYTVTCGEQTQTVAVGVEEATFTGLDYSTDYTISVVAHPEVGSLYWLDSEAATTTVTTGADATDYSGKYLIVAQSGGKYYYMSTWKDGQTVITGGNNRTAVDSGVTEITDYNSSADFDSTVEEEYVWNVEAVEGGYTFANSDKSAWLYLDSNANRANMTTTESDKETFTISKEGNVYTIKATSFTRTLALNSNLFACYASGSYVYDIVLIPFTGTILPKSSLVFDVESVTVDLADFSGNFPEPKATLTVGGEVYAGEYPITYETSDATVAEVNEDGEVTIKGGNGTTATITATVAATATYRGCTASYTITIVDGAAAGPVWKKATSVTVGKEYLLVCESTNMYLTSISTTSTKYGIGSSVTISSDTITSNVEDSAILTLEEGSTAGTYSFKFGSSYLYWGSGNSLATGTTKNTNTSWTITFSNGNAVIKNTKDTTRQVYWNASSPRFACYNKSGQTAVQLYEKQ